MQKKFLFIPLFLLIFGIFFIILGYYLSYTSKHIFVPPTLKESTESFINPEQGFYTTDYIYCNIEKCVNQNSKYDRGFYHLRIDLGPFSKAVNKNQDFNLTDSMLKSLSEILEKYKDSNSSVILRFTYDHFDGKANMEPEISMVLEHIKSMKKIFYEYENIIMNIETGMLGKWGEQHSSDIVTTENMNLLIKEFLINTPDDMIISVRKPLFFSNYFKIDYESLHSLDNYSEKDAYRVGIFNDGYLGNETDLGTYKQHQILKIRENEINWLYKHATHTYFGGEVVNNRSNNNDYTNCKYAINEMFQTHTTYLNSEYNLSTLNNWKNSIYVGNEKKYSKLSNYKYIKNHLGYRFVLDNVELKQKNNQLIGNFTIKNIGFGNVVKQKKMVLLLHIGKSNYEIPLNFDIRSILSKSEKKFSFHVELPKKIKRTKYQIYLRISADDNLLAIRFANKKIFDEKLQANYLGKMNVIY